MSSIELTRKLTGFAKIEAMVVVPGIGLIYYEIFFRPTRQMFEPGLTPFPALPLTMKICLLREIIQQYPLV